MSLTAADAQKLHRLKQQLFRLLLDMGIRAHQQMALLETK